MTGQVRATLLSGFAAAVFGGLLGLTTVDGLRRQSAFDQEPIYPRALYAVDPALAGGTGDCAGCSTFDEGYRWASARHVSDADACFGDDWSRQRGCLAYVQSSRLD
ncbi:MAG TPA: hypothetical protein VF649_10130 [Sphingomonas sp.]|uniref:hypothetical protein n=1 Tax=Sphingomonas sp. TaxID=28214 RepID=UPI002ED849EE